jgi:hypothetical protein
VGQRIRRWDVPREEPDAAVRRLRIAADIFSMRQRDPRTRSSAAPPVTTIVFKKLSPAAGRKAERLKRFVHRSRSTLKSRREYPRRLNTWRQQMVTHLLLLLLIVVILGFEVKVIVRRR